MNTEEMTKAYYEAFPAVITVEDAMRQALKVKVDRDRWRDIADDLFVMLSAYLATEESDAMKNFVQAVFDEQG